jgi:chromosome segregation ATPase
MTAEVQVEEEWFAVKNPNSPEDIESKLNKKIDTLQDLVHQQSVMIQTLSSEIKELKNDLHSTTHQSASQNGRTHELLEELKRVKERELNYALRKHQPVPFMNGESILRWEAIAQSPVFRKHLASTVPITPLGTL